MLIPTLTSLALLLPSPHEESAKVVHVFVLAGQPNMEGKGFPEPLAWQITQSEYQDRWTAYVPGGDFGAFSDKLEASLEENPKRPVYDWAVRDDVWIEFLGNRGGLSVGYGAPSKCFGPELEFGFAVGDHLDDPVLLIKTAWGGKSLGRDFRPPSAGLPSDEELQAMVDQRNERVRNHNEKNPDRPRQETDVESVKAEYGHFYRLMIQNVQETLALLPTRFPELADAEPRMAGFVWFQGWNDQFDPDGSTNYGAYMGHLLRDVRKDLDAPGMPAVVGVVGFDGQLHPPAGRDGKPSARAMIQAGQRVVSTEAEFKGSVLSVETAPFWDMDADAIYRGEGGWSADPEKWRQFGNDRPYHYYGSPWFFAQAGRAFGDAMVKLISEK